MAESGFSPFVGIDVSKERLDIATSENAKGWRVSNDTTGIATLTVQLQSLRPALILVEATGGFEAPLGAEL